MNGAGRIDGVSAFLNMANDAVFINYKGDAIGEEASEVQNAISLGDFLFGVAQQRECRPGFLREFAVPVLVVEADSQHLRTRGLEFGDITLIRLDLPASTGRGGADVEGKNH